MKDTETLIQEAYEDEKELGLLTQSRRNQLFNAGVRAGMDLDYIPGLDDGDAPEYEDDSGHEYEDYKNEAINHLRNQ